MALPTEAVGGWITEPVLNWYGRCDGCGKHRFFIKLYNCYPEEFLSGTGSVFYWQCANCMVATLSAKIAKAENAQAAQATQGGKA